MKQTFFLLIWLLGSTCLQAQDRIIEQPAFDAWNSTTLEVQKIVLSDTATVLHIDAYFRPKFWIQVVKETTLEANGKSYPIRSAVGIKLSEKHWMPESGTDSFQLIFPPLPKGTKTVDFVEGNEERAFRIWGIRLDGSRPESAFANRPATLNEPVLEEPVLKSGIGTLEGKIIGYRPGMEETIGLWAFGILTGGADEYTINIRPDGTFKQEITLQHTSDIVISGNTIYSRFYMNPGETTTLEINMPEICRAQSKKQADKPSLGNKFYFSGAMAGLNNDLSNKQADEIRFTPGSQEEYMQMMKEISTMTTDQFKAYWTEKYQKAKEKLDQQTNMSQAQRQLTDMKLKHQLAEQLIGYSIIEYAYRNVNKIPRDSVLTDYVKPIASASYFDFLPKLISNDLYFLYNGNFAYTLQSIRYANFTGKEIKLEKDQPYPDNTADFARVMGTDKGVLFDIWAAQKLASSIKEFKPMSDEDLAKAEKLPTDLKLALVDMNNKLKQTIEENKKKSGYTVSRVNIADIPSEELFNAIITPYRGKVVFVDFWATWCGPCKSAMKESEPAKKEFESKDVVFLYLAGENSPKGTWEQMIPDIKGEHYRVTDTQWSYLGKKFGVQGVPSYMVIAKDGTPVHFQVGFMGVEKMKEMLNKELAK